MAELESIELDPPEDGADYDTWGLENNQILKRLSKAVGSWLAITTDTGNKTLTALENTNLVLNPTATLTGNLTIQVRDDAPRFWLVANGTDGDFTVGVQCAAGGAVAYVDQGKRTLVLSDGTDCYALGSEALSNLNDPAGASATTRTIREVSASDDLVLGDAGNVVMSTGGSAVTVTIPANADVAFPIGTQIDFVRDGDGELDIAPDTGVTLNSDDSKRTISAKYLAATALKTASDTWTLTGSLVA